MVVKRFIGTLLGVVIGGEAIKQVGNIDFPSGLKGPTQVFISLGVAANAAKGIFKK